MLEEKENALVLRLASDCEVKFRLDAVDRSVLMQYDEFYAFRSLVYETMEEAFNNFRLGRAEYVNAAERAAHLCKGLADTSDALMETCASGILSFLVEKSETEILKPWLGLRPRQEIINLFADYVSRWKAKFGSGGVAPNGNTGRVTS